MAENSNTLLVVAALGIGGYFLATQGQRRRPGVAGAISGAPPPVPNTLPLEPAAIESTPAPPPVYAPPAKVKSKLAIGAKIASGAFGKANSVLNNKAVGYIAGATGQGQVLAGAKAGAKVVGKTASVAKSAAKKLKFW